MRDQQGDVDESEYGEIDEEVEAMGSELREDGPAARSFDPTPYMRQLRGRGGSQDYLDVKFRLLWLRREHPDAEILTEHVQIDTTLAIFKATVTIPTGGKATGYGSETAADFADFIEKAETKAIGRALNALGYGAQFGDRNGEEGELPTPRPLATVSPAQPSSRATSRPAVDPVAKSVLPAPSASVAPIPVPGNSQSGAPLSVAPTDSPPPPAPSAEVTDQLVSPPPLGSHQERGANPRAGASKKGERTTERGSAAAAPLSAPSESPGEVAGSGAEPDLADYSWTAFWPWARGLGLNGPGPVEGLIGRPTTGLSPAELRNLILTARREA